MKTKNTFQFISIILFLLLSISTMGQQIGGFNFQAVARDADGEVLPKTDIKVVLAIQSVSGDILWEETHNLTTSNKGLFTVSHKEHKQ